MMVLFQEERIFLIIINNLANLIVVVSTDVLPYLFGKILNTYTLQNERLYVIDIIELSLMLLCAIKAILYVDQMQSENSIPAITLKQRLINFGVDKWELLNESQKSYIKKAWSVITFKWRWQIAMNIPYLMIFALDRTVPEVHKFDMALLASITSRLPIPTFISSWMGV